MNEAHSPKTAKILKAQQQIWNGKYFDTDGNDNAQNSPDHLEGNESQRVAVN